MKYLKAFFNYILSLLKPKKKAEMPELAWNPFLKYPRNEPCYCGSRVKYKKCCQSTEAKVIPKAYVEAASTLIKKVRNDRLA